MSPWNVLHLGWAPIATFLVAGMTSGAPAGESPDALDRLSEEIIRGELLAESPEEFGEPPSVRWTVANGDARHLVVSAGLLLRSVEHGDAADFAGDDGSGAEVRLDLVRPDGWNVSFALSQATNDVYSAVDESSAEIDRYLLGMERSWSVGRSIALATGVGVVWNDLEIEAGDPKRDIDGFGGYIEIRMTVSFAKRFRLGFGGRALFWEGEDGFGNTGSELSTTFATELGFCF